MTPRRLTHLYVNLVAGTAVLLAAYTGNPWAGLVPCVLFVFVVFPRWRRPVVRLIDRLIRLAAKTQKGAACDRRDPE